MSLASVTRGVASLYIQSPNPATHPHTSPPVTQFKTVRPGFAAAFQVHRLRLWPANCNLGDFEVDQGHELLPPMEVPVAKVTLENHSGDAELECPRIVALEKPYLLRLASIESCK